MSLNTYQRHHRWLVAPFHCFIFILSPERWAIAFERAAAAMTRTVVFDTTPLARRLQRIDVISSVRNVLLPRSAALRWLDWRLRKDCWTVLWCFIVFTELWVRKTAVPEPEPPIRLLPAPATYDDFQSRHLVVPEEVPRAEKSLGVPLGVQVIHLLQDLYPIVSTHQRDAAGDPRQRYDEAYSLVYRVTRDKAQWHDDLVAASRDRNLLGALAVGGPFAKLLQRAQAGSDAYVIDLDYLNAYGVRPGLCHLGCRINFRALQGALRVSDIEYDGERVTPDSARWDLVERIAQAALVTHVTVWRQGMEYHVGGLVAVPVLSHNYLPAAHPLRRLMAPHFARWITTSKHTHLTLRRQGFDVTGFAFPRDEILRYYEDGAAAFDIRRLDVACDAGARGIGSDLEYPYLPQAVAYYNLFQTYVSRYVDCYYPTEHALQSDPHVRLWFEALDRQLVGGIRSYVADITTPDLMRLCTLLMYSASVAHTENSLRNFAEFMPTTVRQDGRQQSVGEVQNTINFQLLIATPTTLLLADNSHLALDARGAEIMRAFYRDLVETQRRMEAEPQRYWQLFPAELEASVSC